MPSTTCLPSVLPCRETGKRRRCERALFRCKRRAERENQPEPEPERNRRPALSPSRTPRHSPIDALPTFRHLSCPESHRSNSAAIAPLKPTTPALSVSASVVTVAASARVDDDDDHHHHHHRTPVDGLPIGRATSLALLPRPFAPHLRCTAPTRTERLPCTALHCTVLSPRDRRQVRWPCCFFSLPLLSFSPGLSAPSPLPCSVTRRRSCLLSSLVSRRLRLPAFLRPAPSSRAWREEEAVNGRRATHGRLGSALLSTVPRSGSRSPSVTLTHDFSTYLSCGRHSPTRPLRLSTLPFGIPALTYCLPALPYGPRATTATKALSSSSCAAPPSCKIRPAPIPIPSGARSLDTAGQTRKPVRLILLHQPSFCPGLTCAVQADRQTTPTRAGAC